MFADTVTWIVGLVVLMISLVLEGVAFLHCVTRKSGGFMVVGAIPKAGWALITGGSFLLTFFFGATFLSASGSFIFGLLGMAGFVASMVYLLDIRPALKDALGGRGGW